MLMPLLLTLLGKQKFGIWQTILSLMGYVSLLNFGMGNGLRNTIAKYSVDQNMEAIGNFIGQTVSRMSLIIGGFTLLLIGISFFANDMSWLFKDVDAIKSEVNMAIYIFLFFFLLNMVCSLSSAVAFGLNRSYLPGLVNLVYLLLVYGVLFFASKVYSFDLIKVALLFGLLQVFSNLVFFGWLLRRYSIKLDFSRKYDLSETSKLAAGFFVVQALSVMFLTGDNFIVSKLLGPQQTADYSVLSKIYFTLITLFSVLLISFWNGVTVAKAKGDTRWIKKQLKRLFILSAGVVLAGLLIAFIYPFILTLWFGKNNTLHLGRLSFFLFSIYAFIHCLNAVLANYQNGIGDLRIQILSNLIIVSILVIGAFIIDIPKYGYNSLVIIKIVAISIGTIINLRSLTYIK